MSKVRGYIFSRPFMGERVPQHIQNLVIRDFCNKNSLEFLLSATEYAMPDSQLILEQVMIELMSINGIVAYSLFQMPEDPTRRSQIFERVVNLNKTLYFASEGIRAVSFGDFERIEMIWRIRQTLPNCINYV